MTHLQQRKEAAIYAQKATLALLGWDELVYCYYKYHTGLAYLWTYTGHDAEAVAYLERQPLFWKWWKMNWTIREEEFITGSRLVHPNDHERYFKDMNNAEDLAKEISPNGRILGDSYSVMIGACQREYLNTRDKP